MTKLPSGHRLGRGVKIGQTPLGCFYRPLGRVAVASEDHVLILLNPNSCETSERELSGKF